jgi:two-component system invasion response regulator UvrY
MSIKVLLADESDMMRAAMRQILAVERSIEIVGEARSFSDAVQMVADIKPEVLLLDLFLPEKRHFAPEFVRSQLRSVPRTLVLSISNDTEAKALAAGYGAQALLDRRNLSGNIIPAILNCCERGEVSKTSTPPPRAFRTKSRSSRRLKKL